MVAIRELPNNFANLPILFELMAMLLFQQKINCPKLSKFLLLVKTIDYYFHYDHRLNIG